MFGAEEMYTGLNVAGVIAVIDTYQGYPAIFNDSIIPSDISTEGKTINYYQYTSANLANLVREYIFSVNCRAATFQGVCTIAAAVIAALNCKQISGCMFIVSALAVIQPQDETDGYNFPLEVRVKKAETADG
jgi:hypothetical protein